MDYTIHWLPLVVATVINLIIGFLWYSPKFFSGYWMQHSGAKMVEDKSQMKGLMARSLVIQTVVTAIMVYIFGVLAYSVFALTLGTIMHLAFLVWVGLMVPCYIGTVIWEGKPWKLFLIYSLNQLVNVLVIAFVYSWLG